VTSTDVACCASPSTSRDDALLDQHVTALQDPGFTWIRLNLSEPAMALGVARLVVDACCAADCVAPLDVIGSFVVPPLDGQATRDFQSLHFDCGLPLDSKIEQDVARYTALHVPSAVEGVSAATRPVPLAALLTQRPWPSRTELIAPFVAYGKTHGARNDARGYFEGILARVVEAAASSPVLPSVKAEPDFLCGTEFDSLRAGLRFFEDHSLRVEDVQHEIALSPGELLVFNNLTVAHGRRGTRRPGELRQWIFGHKGLSVDCQSELRDLVVAAFLGSHRRSVSHAIRGHAARVMLWWATTMEPLTDAPRIWIMRRKTVTSGQPLRIRFRGSKSEPLPLPAPPNQQRPERAVVTSSTPHCEIHVFGKVLRVAADAGE
jgi:hypothetical protein